MTLTPELMIAAEASIRSGKAILKSYGSSSSVVQVKDDGTPLTGADMISNELILRSLSVTGLPVLSEEGGQVHYEDRKHWQQFWMVDPLDGTKEFLSGTGEFTVNVALIDRQVPVLGVIYAPVTDELYYASKETGAYRVSQASKAAAASSLLCDTGSSLKNPSTCRVLVSRSHMNDQTLQYIDQLKTQYPELEIIEKGSSLKFCMLAAGDADIYPRFGDTMEWDTAAGHAILRVVGKKLAEHTSGLELKYNKIDLKNPYFIAGHKL